MFLGLLCPRYIILHLSTLNSILHFFAQSLTIFRSSCSVLLPCMPVNFLLFLLVIMRLNSLLSSAKRLNGDRTPSGRSFINIRNRIGPSTDPCSTPLVTFLGDDAVPLITTLWILPFKKSLTQSKI
ncbi:unnamed protein product [Meganyctiphanes norvegica]|uniref:Uncharacterized protein n=1 Tax=Meganyctiphanes norvegica TaxID=48144 RepID=A0AAV2SSC6_MEGNR